MSQDLSRDKKPASLSDEPWDGIHRRPEGRHIRQWKVTRKAVGEQSSINCSSKDTLLLMDSGQGTVTIRATPICMVNRSWTARLREPRVFQRR